MSAMTLSDIARVTDGRLHGSDVSVSGITTDTRRVAANDLFVALQGERFDGNDFVDDAATRGAIAAVVTRAPQRLRDFVLVGDSRLALGRIAQLNRERFPRPVLAVTGSSGKTSCKELLAAILRCSGPVLATEGNLNNEVGVPLTLLQLAPEHRFAVIEMGARAPGDIRYLCQFAKPDIAVLTNAQPAHIEVFGDLDTIARTKGEIFESLPGGGTAIINADDRYAPQWQSLAAGRRQWRFSVTDAAAEFYARDIREQIPEGLRFTLVCAEGDIDVRLPLLGRHMVANALAAAAAARAAGASLQMIVDGLASVRPVTGRMCARRVGDLVLIDDTYNANPGSTRAAIDVLATASGRRILALGHMAELGDRAAEFHREIGAHAAACGIDCVYATGRWASDVAQGFGARTRVFDNKQTLALALAKDVSAGDTVLVKGSRSAGMEDVVEHLESGRAGPGIC